jgi:DtxR family Mn-dependent transcriptional regulator
MRIQESGENYLETILILQNKNGSVRSIDIANELDYTKASISRAMSILKKAGYIAVDDGGHILLTESGLEKARQIYERHQLITSFLINALNIDAVTADTDACRIEHVISQTSFDHIKDWVEAHKETLKNKEY